MTRKTKAVRDDADADELGRRVDDDTAEHPYYYDDAHGYEEFDPNEADEADDESTTSSES